MVDASGRLGIFFESSLNSYMHDLISFVILLELYVLFGQLDWVFLQREKCLALGSILRCPFPVTEGAAR